MPLFRILIALVCIALGVAVGALNPQPVSLDFGFAILRSTLGVSLLVAVLVGAIVGGIMLGVSIVLPLQQQLRRERRARPVANGVGDS